MKNTRQYVCRYYHDGSWWGQDIVAYDNADAEARIAKMGILQLQGELKAVIPAYPTTGLFVRLLCWFKNAQGVPPPASTPANPPKEGHSAPVGEISVDDWIKKNESWLTKNGVYTITKFVSEMRGKCVPKSFPSSRCVSILR